jgi:hypothetical protein
MNFTTRLNGAANLNHALDSLPRKINGELPRIVKTEARGMAVQLAIATRPTGITEKAHKRGKANVAKDIGKVFASPAEAFEVIQKTDPDAAERFWANVKNRRFARAQTALQKSNSAWNRLTVGRLNRSLHSSSKNSEGLVQIKTPLQVVTSADARENYIRQIQKRVGFAKGVWANAAKSLGGQVRNLAQWITRHKQSPGSSKFERIGGRTSASLKSTLDYMDDVLKYKSINYAMRIAEKNLRKALVIASKKAADATRSRMRRG